MKFETIKYRTKFKKGDCLMSLRGNNNKQIFIPINGKSYLALRHCDDGVRIAHGDLRVGDEMFWHGTRDYAARKEIK